MEYLYIMKNIITEILRIKQMMGIFESLEDDKKISDEFSQLVKNSSIDDLTNNKKFNIFR